MCGNYLHRKKITATIILLIMSMMVVNRALFLHTHKIAAGVYITHAHPFDKTTDKTPLKHHHHSKAAFSFLTTYTLFTFTAAFLFISRVFFSRVVSCECPAILHVTKAFSRLADRAPPVF